MLCVVIVEMVMKMNTKTYSELISIPTYEERFKYLQIKGAVGIDTFGYDRYLNQTLYRSAEWKRLRNEIIIRDDGCDLAFDGYQINSRILIHHLNPISVNDVKNRNPKVFDPENLVCVSHITHNAIHYGDESLLVKDPVVRSANDTCPWKQTGRR